MHLKKINIYLFFFAAVFNEQIFAMETGNNNNAQQLWEIPSFQNFKDTYLPNTVTYPELFEQSCPDGIENADSVYTENVKKTYKINKPIVSQDELLKAINNVAETIGDSVSSAAWVDGNPLTQYFFKQQVPATKIELSKPEHSRLFAAFEKKLFLDDTKNEEIVFFGDLHGGCKSLIKALEPYIEKESFSLNAHKKNSHLAFLGDFVDSGKDGAETLYLLGRIWAANPDNVHVIRGNHEDALFNKRQLFFQELAYKYGEITDSSFFFERYKLDDSIYNKITRFYDYMPLALFVGNRRYTFFCNDWRIACHGGFEVGDVNIQQLLQHPAKVAYKLIGRPLEEDSNLSIIERRTNFDDICKKHKITVDKVDEFNFDSTCVDFIPVSPMSGKTLRNLEVSEACTIGYAWSLFDENCNHNADLSYAPNLNAWIFGLKLTKILFERSSTWRNRLVGMVRAHQHTSFPDEYTKHPMMEKMFKNKGLWTMWQPKPNPALYGAVTTLMVAPDTVYGVAKEAKPNSNHKHFPGVINYAPLIMKPERNWFTVSVQTKSEEIKNILPQQFVDNHNRLMHENHQKNIQNDSSKREPKQKWCAIL